MKLDFKKYQFFNLPKPFNKSDYREVCDLVVDKLKCNSAIRSIYLVGGHWLPGISDLDIFIVYKRKKKKRIKIPSPWSLSEKASYLFTHNYGNYDEDNFKNLSYIIPRIRLELLWGKDIIVRSAKKELSLKNYKFLNAILIFDLLINKLLLFTRYTKTYHINVRRVLGEIYSLIYTLKMIKIIRSEAIQTDFPDKIKQLRLNWFNNKQEDNLRKLIVLLEESIDLILEIMLKLNEFVVAENLPMENFVFQNRRYYICFDKKWTKKKFLNNFINDYLVIKKPFSKRKIENFKLVLPLPLSYFLLPYVSHSGPLSEYIRKNLISFKKGKILNNKGINSHIKATNKLALAGVNRGFAKITFSYGYLTKKQTLLSRLGASTMLFLRKIK